LSEPVCVSVPGRICLAGEKLDWTGGPSIACAIDELRVYVSVSERYETTTTCVRSYSPFHTTDEFTVETASQFQKLPLDMARAAYCALWEYFPTIPPLTIEIVSTLPHSAGLSSSAALTLAVIGAVNSYLDLQLPTEAVCRLAYAAEAQFLRTGCGQMDQYTCGLGGLLHLDCGHEPPLIVELPPLPEEVALVIGETTARHRAGNVISGVRQRLQEGEASAETYFRETRLAVDELYQVLASPAPDLEAIGAILTRCHGFIRDYAQVSTPEIESCVDSALAAGALGAKLTGAGNGGCMFAMVRKTHVAAVVQALSRMGASPHVCTVAEMGLRVEREETFEALAR